MKLRKVINFFLIEVFQRLNQILHVLHASHSSSESKEVFKDSFVSKILYLGAVQSKFYDLSVRKLTRYF